MPHDPTRAEGDAPDAGAIDRLTADLADALVPEPPDAAAADRIRARLLRRIADAEIERHRTVRADEGRWHDIGGGLSLKVLHHDAGLMSYLVRMAPGSALPPHRHPVDEECVVLEGSLEIGSLQVGAGGFHLGRKGVPHAQIRSVDGALIFLRGAAPEPAQLL